MKTTISMSPRVAASVVLLLATALSATAPAAEPRLVDVRRIWDRAPNNAFTDLVRFRERWFCVFREGARHVSPDGAVRVITSADGQAWESAALLTSPTYDLRDPHVVAMPDGRLLLLAVGVVRDGNVRHPTTLEVQSLAWTSDDGLTWGEAQPVGDPWFWLWHVRWHGERAYAVGYDCHPEASEHWGTRPAASPAAGAGDDRRPEASVRLYTTTDGRKFETVVDRLFDKGDPNESSLVFVGDTAHCLLRRDPGSGLIGTATAPYTQWTWKELGPRIGGPAMIRLPDGRLAAVVRLYDEPRRTSLCWIDPAQGTLKEFLKLPSAGDSSYAGLVLHDGLLWISYYSSHDEKTSIYLARVRID